MNGTLVVGPALATLSYSQTYDHFTSCRELHGSDCSEGRDRRLPVSPRSWRRDHQTSCPQCVGSNVFLGCKLPVSLLSERFVLLDPTDSNPRVCGCMQTLRGRSYALAMPPSELCARVIPSAMRMTKSSANLKQRRSRLP